MKTMIENQTPYLGKVKFRFQKSPNYIGKSILNQVHLDLGFVKLVSRVFPEKDKNGWIPDINKIYKINRFTGGYIRKYSWSHSGETFNIPNSFVSKDGTLIGDLRTGWSYYQNNLKVCDDFPKGVAVKYDDVEKTTHHASLKYGTPKIVGYVTSTHRGESLFKIGDRYFESDYIPNIQDYDEHEWNKYNSEFIQSIKNTKDSNERKKIEEGGIKNFIPYSRLGKEKIKTLSEAKQSAINLYTYLSS